MCDRSLEPEVESEIERRWRKNRETPWGGEGRLLWPFLSLDKPRPKLPAVTVAW